MGRILAWSALTSGNKIETSGAIRYAEALEHTMLPARANAGSISTAASAGNAENARGTDADSGVVGSIDISFAHSGMSPVRIQ